MDNTTRTSPCVEGDTLKWYTGDVFKIKWTLNLLEDDEEIIYQNEDALVFCFYSNPALIPIHTFTFTGAEIVDNAVTLDFNEDVTKFFTEGKYTYCIKFFRASDGRVVTVTAKGKVEVEKCH